MDPYPGLRNAKVDFNMPFLRCIDCDLILFAVMRLLIKYAYTTKCDYGKFTISYVMRISFGEVSFTISNALTFREDGKDLPVYALIDQLVGKKAEDYNDKEISRMNIRIYLSEMKGSTTPFIFNDKIASKLWECIENKVVVEPKKARTIGYLVRPGDDLSSAEKGIETYFSEDYPDFVFKTFEERSNKMLFDFIERLAVVVRHNPSILTVYLHNLSRFDGILLLKYYASRGDKYAIKPLMRNHRLYQIAVYLGGVMLKALEIYWTICNVDIVTKLTLSSLALTIFRTNYYVQNNWSIYIPNRNEDTFIRRGYYGGHSDAYIPCGDNLYYYDVNSLYPYIMKSYTMPRGETVWHGKLEGQDLDNLFGFIEAYVVCPRTISPPFLPYRDEKNQTLLFPIGKFVDVYYSEELKYARDIGYQSIPLSSYLFEKKNSIPFKSFVFNIFDRRQEAKRAGNDTMSYVYKILMNSLYGRFGINPKSTVTEIYDYDRYNYLIKKSDLILGDKLSEHYYNTLIYLEQS
ncbi:uncharacterized protein LOC111371388 [Olea europaea var. sylvestris]|uniref:uncharacterized protein LOC111371388 n=1 Tax=Olea europaea var. sylvestris TaxID=158386 RepID=UPI000C1D5130|nr:uncharacterized protein LOC111371388 [Olea europaea var. sylvestris]